METDGKISLDESSCPQDEILTPLRFLISTPDNYKKTCTTALVFLAIKNHQHETFTDEHGTRRPVLSTEKAVSEMICQMTNGAKQLSQGTISKEIKKINAHTVNFNGKFYTINKVLGEYLVTEINDFQNQVHEMLSASGIFLNNPNGTSTAFAVKASQDDLPIVEKWLRQEIRWDLFKLFIEDDTIIVMLRVDTTSYKATSKKLKNALTGEGLINTNFALRNFGKSRRP